MTQHTAGPWRAQRQVEQHDDRTRDYPYFEIVLADRPDGRRAGYVARVDGMRNETQEANARLIAVAPDQHEFIGQIARMKTEDEFGDDPPPSEDWISTLNDLIVEARKLYAKAEGRQP